MQILMIAFVALAGVLTTVQSGANAQLVHSLGQTWIVALLVSLVTTACFAAVVLVIRPSLPEGGQLAATPWWSWTGGLCGALFVTGTLFFECTSKRGQAASRGSGTATLRLVGDAW